MIVKSSLAAALLVAAGSLAVAQQAPTAATFIAPVIGSAGPAIGVVRLFNPGEANATVTARVRAGNSADVVNTVSIVVGPHTTAQASVAGLVGQSGNQYSIALTSTGSVLAQHLLGNAADGSWRNLTSCGSALSGPTKSLISLSTGATPGMTSHLVLHVTGPSAASATVTIADSATGQIRGTWRSPSIPAGSMSRAIPASQVLAEAGVSVSAALPFVNLTLDESFPGHAQHLAQTTAGLTTDLTSACTILAGGA